MAFSFFVKGFRLPRAGSLRFGASFFLSNPHVDCSLANCQTGVKKKMLVPKDFFKKNPSMS